MFEYFVSALHNLGRKKLRSALTVSGIAIGVASVIIIGAIGQGGKAAVSGELDSLGVDGLNVRPQSMTTGLTGSVLTMEDAEACSSLNGVEAAMPVIMQMGAAFNRGDSKNVLFWGVDSNAPGIFSMKLKYGRMLSRSDVESHSAVCIVDEGYAKTAYKRSNITGKKITVYLGDSYKELKVVGVVDQGSSLLYSIAGSYVPSFIYLPYTTEQDLKGKTNIDQIAVKMKNNNDLDKAGEKIVNLLNKIHGGSGGFVADNMLKQKQRLSDMLGIVTLVVSAIGAISLIVAGLSIMTVMTVSVNERTREIGIKKAIGATKKNILEEFLSEALVISLAGCAAGIAGGMLLCGVASLILRFDLMVRPATVLYSSGFAAAVGVLFGVYPAVKASKLKPVDALRNE